MNKTNKTKDTILIVDDNPKNIQVAASILSTQGYQISFDEDGKSALQHTKAVKFDLILMDIMMPGMDGYEACIRLKNDPETKDIPLIFLTAKADPESIIRGFEAGGVDYITKPFNEAELLARVDTHIELKQYRDHLERLVQERTEAIKVMMQIREEISVGIQKKITANIIHLVLPMLEKLGETLTKPNQKECLSIIESGLTEILSDFSQKLSSPGFNLTPTEMKIAGLIKEGRSGKQISALLGISENTLIFHRSNIRKKLGLTNLKTGLKAFLKSMNRTDDLSAI